MGLGATNKRKGSEAERYYAIAFRNLGFLHCATSRFASKKHDNAKVDLIDIPFNIQIKAGVQKGMNPAKELMIMKDAVTNMFASDEPIHKKPFLVIHKKQVGVGKKRAEHHEIVYMSDVQFKSFNLPASVETVYSKTFKFETSSEFKTVVGITFKCFIDNIVNNIYLKNEQSNSNLESGD